jgi:hypothetical protein
MPLVYRGEDGATLTFPDIQVTGYTLRSNLRVMTERALIHSMLPDAALYGQHRGVCRRLRLCGLHHRPYLVRTSSQFVNTLSNTLVMAVSDTFNDRVCRSGLMVVAIMLLALGGSVCLIMDIRTMDRFESTRGKQLTITVSE